MGSSKAETAALGTPAAPLLITLINHSTPTCAASLLGECAHTGLHGCQHVGRDREGGRQRWSPRSGTREADGAQSNCTSPALVGGLFPGLTDPLQRQGAQTTRFWLPSTVCQHSPLLDPQRVVVLLGKQRKAKQGVAEWCEELGNEEQNHLVQRVYCKFPGALCAPGSEQVVGLSSRQASFTRTRCGSSLEKSRKSLQEQCPAAHSHHMNCAFLPGGSHFGACPGLCACRGRGEVAGTAPFPGGK